MLIRGERRGASGTAGTRSKGTYSLFPRSDAEVPSLPRTAAGARAQLSVTGSALAKNAPRSWTGANDIAVDIKHGMLQMICIRICM